MPVRKREDVDRRIAELWGQGIKECREIGRRLDRPNSVVSRRISAMIRQGRWPYSDPPVRDSSRPRRPKAGRDGAHPALIKESSIARRRVVITGFGVVTPPFDPSRPLPKDS